MSWDTGPIPKRWRQRCPTRFSSAISRAKPLAKAYASADVFVFPSTTDTFGNVIIEAQASGLPVIVSDLGGPKELVEDGVNGIVTKAHDAEDVARAISLLAGDAKLRARMGEKARQSVVDRSWPDAFRKFWQTTESINSIRFQMIADLMSVRACTCLLCPLDRRSRRRSSGRTKQSGRSRKSCASGISISAISTAKTARN